MDYWEQLNTIVDNSLKSGSFRSLIYNMIPASTEKLLDFGYGDGALLLKLKRDKDCREIYGIEVKEYPCDGLLDKTWHINLDDESAELGEEFNNYFSYIISSNVLEHVYDPWYVLSKLRQYLAPSGKMILEVPNVQCWESLYRILAGEFPYTSGAHFDFTHIRWYTLKSFTEMLGKVGLEPEYSHLKIKDEYMQHIRDIKDTNTLQLPPPGIPSDGARLSITFPFNIKEIYPLFYAPQFVVVCNKGRKENRVEKTMSDGRLEYHRLMYDNPVKMIPKMISDPLHPIIVRKLGKNYDLKGISQSL